MPKGKALFFIKRLINKLFVQISVEILWTADYIRIFAPQTRVVSPKMKYFACASKLHVIMSKNNQFYSVIPFNQQGGVNEEYI